ncbi:MAG: protein translocase subunit SecF [Gammaproteobacteria bacterium]|nr:MAG: protein translocase subunit SecF [Gammaproteobacteria bacterium]
MKFLHGNSKINFMGSRNFSAIFSIALIVISIASVAVQQLNFGIDFTGGTLIGVTYEQPADLNKARVQLKEAGFKDAVVKYFGTNTDVDIHVPPTTEVESKKVGELVMDTLQKDGTKVELRRQDFVGPQVGNELTEKGTQAIVIALIAILIYVALRFQLKLAAGSIAALAHDVIITVGVFSILQIDFDLTIVAALLAVIGYSLNDTIVVFDRLRENFRKMREVTPVEVVNASINQTFGRTLMTSITTMLVLLALFFLGGEDLRGFALALIIGVLVGTYSSIYVASAMALKLGICKEDLMLPEKEGADIEVGPEI